MCRKSPAFRLASHVLLILVVSARSKATPIDSPSTPGFSVVLPAVASLHGLPPTFFHSDVAILNLSSQRAAIVRATYRCGAPSCAGSSRIVEIAPRQLSVLEDIVASLFGAPETSGAIEFESTEPIVVTSRLYTPGRPAATLGMLVPGLGPDDGFADSELVNLSHSVNPSVGFRTNIGVFNPSDQSRTLFISCRDASYAALGFISRNVSGHQLLQINDGELFDGFGVARSVPSFWCDVRADSVGPLYSWAAVIDNRSNDATFIRGEQFFAPPRVLTLPAAASLHGAGGTEFRSDVAVFNDDVIAPVEVMARYRCLLTPCSESEKTFVLGPGAFRVFQDVVTTLFERPGSAGWIEFIPSRHVSVTSRLYTAAPGTGTVGMSVPALGPLEGTSAQVLPILATGSRVNVGVINPDGAPQVVTIRVYSETERLLGTLTRLLFEREGTQVNDVLGEIGLAGEVSAAYVTVEGSRPPFRIFSYAAIVDDESQDPILVVGQDDPEPPPIERPAAVQ